VGVYTSEFFEAHRAGARRSAGVVVPLVRSLVRTHSVIDAGCGQGTWLAVFREHGVEDVVGVDGDYVDRRRLEIPAELFRPHDLNQPLRLERTFDLVVSLEVAEHLPAACADAFIDSLTRLGPVVLFSAAAPYQGGTNHVNEQWPAYWAERFGRHGYLPIDCLRRRLWANDAVEWWYAQNTFLYAERSYLEARPLLRREYEAAGPVALPLVHPTRYREWVEWGLSLCGASPAAGPDDGREGGAG
jgi:SAM-dependent methyltransferase